MSKFLSLENIYKAFNLKTVDETVIFDDFCLEVKEGEFVSIVGSNGSGKTTLLNLISGSSMVDSGKIVLKDENLNHVKESKRAKSIGRVFQDPSLSTAPNLTVAENLALADNKGKRYGLTFAVNKKKAQEYYDLLKPLNLGLEEKLNTKVKSLSGGQRQVLALIMATMKPLDLLLLDEHTAALDPKTSQVIMELTDKIVKEKKITTIMVTHNLRFAKDYGNRLLMFNEGQIVLDVSGEDKEKTKIEDLLKIFNEISIECGN